MEALVAYAPLLARGSLVTIALAVLGFALATVFGGLGAAGRLGGGRVLQAAVLAYTTVVRGVPDLVMMLLIYFGGQRLTNLAAGLLGMERVDVSPFVAGVLALGFVYGAYLTETFRGAYLSVPVSQIEAARSLGLRGLRLQRLVVLPQLTRMALPGTANVWQVLVKATALVSVIGLQDLVGLADAAGKTTREPFVFFSAVLLVYLGITWVSTQLFARAERRTALVGRDAH
jgi:His/Glu/Gln/Arg/opine family amino acid ABC transporter permease subunit